MRKTHLTPSHFNQISIVPANTWKMILNALNKYHSLPLSLATWSATTFITGWVRYRCRRAPQGLHRSGDGYTRKFDDITEDMIPKTSCIDGSLLWDDSIESLFRHTVEYISHCFSNGNVFNPKFYLIEMEEEFAGFHINANGVKPTKKMSEVVIHISTSTSITGIRSWFGLVNQVSYACSQAEVMAPCREFYWNDTGTSV